MANIDTLNSVLTIIDNSQDPHYQNATYLVQNYFCPDSQNPVVGITAYGLASPNFTGQADIISMFEELFAAFKNFRFTQMADSDLLYSSDNDQIAIQATMTGTHVGKWFPNGPHSSNPISGINPKGKPLSIPVCGIFAFNNSNQICVLSLFFDRYRMQQQLQ